MTYGNHTLAGILESGMGFDDAQKNLVAIVIILLSALAAGSVFGSGIGLVSTIAAATLFAWGGWIDPAWIGIAILFAFAGYVWMGRGGAAG